MTKSCAAYGCTNSSDKTECKQKNISFHRFPLKDSNRLKQWLTNLKRENFEPTEHSVLCSEHFNDEDFENITPSNKRRILKQDTVPSKFSFSKSAVKRKRKLHQIRRADKIPTNDSRLCSCHFKDGKKENGPTIFFYREGKQFDFPDPEKRFRKKVLSSLEDDTPNPDGSPTLNLEDYLFDSARKLRERKEKNTPNCPCCDAYTPCNAIHKKYKRNYLQKNVIKDDKTSSIDKNVAIVKITNEMITSSSDISESNSNSGGFHLLPITIETPTIYSYLPATVISSNFLSSAITTEQVLLAANSSGNTPLTITNYIPSTTLTPADIPFRTDKFVNSPSIPQSTIKIKSEETLSNNLESVQENDLLESDVDSVQNGSSDSVSESNISCASEQINNVTHADAFCAAETLLRYMMNQDDVNSTDITFILTLAQKIKKRLSVKEENTPENL